LADVAQTAKADSKAAASNQSKPAAKLAFKEQKELDGIPAHIDQLETEQTAINTQLADSSLYQTDDKVQAASVKKLQARLVEIENQLENLLARWEELGAK
jgi:ATP-binding cassette subfamily F protein uup